MNIPIPERDDGDYLRKFRANHGALLRGPDSGLCIFLEGMVHVNITCIVYHLRSTPK